MAKKTDDLVERLIEKTRTGDVEWEAAERESTFLTTFSKSTVRIDSDGEFFIFNEGGELIEHVEPSEVYPYSTLYEAARRQVLNVDSFIDGIMDELGGR